MTTKFTNIFQDGEVTGQNPDAQADLYQISDAQRDHNYWQDKIVDIIKNMYTAPGLDCLILYGGVVTNAGSGLVNISAGAALAKDADDNIRYVKIPALSGVALPSGWNDDRQIWVVLKYAYIQSSETRAHHTTTENYHYILQDTYVGASDSDDLFVDSDPNSTPDSAVCLGSFKMNGTTYTDMTGERSTERTLTSPKINEAVALTATATELNILDDYAGLKGSLFKNVIHNGNMDIAQKGAGPFTSATTPANSDGNILIDRWRLLSDGNDIVDVSQVAVTDLPGSEFAMLLDVETANKKFAILQQIEKKNAYKYFNKNGALSFQTKKTGTTINTLRCAIVSWASTADAPTADIVSAWGGAGTDPTLAANFTYENVPADLTLSTSWQKFTATGLIDTASMANIGIFIWTDDVTMDVGDLLYITQVQLNEGSVALPFQPRHYSEELALCQRYYTTGNYHLLSNGADASYFGAIHHYRTSLRTAATPTLTEASKTNADSATITTVDVEGFFAYSKTTGAVTIAEVAGTYVVSAEL